MHAVRIHIGVHCVCLPSTARAQPGRPAAGQGFFAPPYKEALPLMTGPLKFDGRFDKAVEQGVRFCRTRLEFRVGLRPDIERMDILRQLNEFGKLTVRACAAYPQARIFKLLFIRYIDFITMAVTFRHVFASIQPGSKGTGLQYCRISPQPHALPS